MRVLGHILDELQQRELGRRTSEAIGKIARQLNVLEEDHEALTLHVAGIKKKAANGRS
jgi:hypothetical protein